MMNEYQDHGSDDEDEKQAVLQDPKYSPGPEEPDTNQEEFAVPF